MNQPQQDPMGQDRELKRILGELAGACSLCWTLAPESVFDSTKASEFVTEAYWKVRDLVAAELADLRQVAQGLRDENERLWSVEIAYLRAQLAHAEGEVERYKTAVVIARSDEALDMKIMSDLQAKHSYTISEWKKEEALWKEREADLLSKLEKIIEPNLGHPNSH